MSYIFYLVDLTMKTFKDLEYQPDTLPIEFAEYSIERRRLQFDNGYGVSVIRGKGTYGYERGLYELGVLHNDELISGCIIGSLSEEEVTEKMQELQLLPPKEDVKT